MAGKKSVSQWEDLFKSADKDGNGSLDEFELRDLLKRGNSNLKDSQIAETFVFFDGPQGDKKITKEEFVSGMNKFADFLKKLEGLFRQYDTDNSKKLDRKELTKLLAASGHKFTDEEVQEILKDADKSGDGQVDFNEFLNACT